ncbi:MAG: hypothetical protein AB8F95_03150 [Bacteroidia bacterium]
MSLLWSACAEDVMLPESKPLLRVESISPDAISEFENEVTLILYYEDGDGDLGSEDPDEAVLYVQDSRLDQADEYHVQPLAPLDSNIPIQGTLAIKLNPFFLLGNGTEETISLTVSIRDRAGNLSEPVEAPSIKVSR